MFKVKYISVYFIVYLILSLKLFGGVQPRTPGIKIALFHFNLQRGNEKSSKISWEVEQRLRQTLLDYGYYVHFFDIQNPVLFFKKNPGFSFVISGLVTCTLNTTISVRIYQKGKNRPQRIVTTGEESDYLIISEVIRYLSTKGVLQKLIEHRTKVLREKSSSITSIEDRILMGLLLRKQRKWQEAINIFKKILLVYPNDVDIHYDLYLCYKGIADPEKMLEYLTKAYKLDPHHEAVTNAMGNHYFNKGKYNDAIAVYSILLESPQNAPIAHWNISLVYRRKGDINKAKEHLNMITREDPLFIKAARLLAEIEDQEKAEKASRKYVGIISIVILLSINLLFVRKIFRGYKFGSKKLNEMILPLAVAIISGIFTIVTTLLTFILSK